MASIFIDPNSSNFAQGAKVQLAFLIHLGTSIVMEDNAACVALANDGDKYQPRTRHLSIKWHHFCDLVKSKDLAITKIGTKENEADIFTKSVPYPQFSYL